MAKAKVADLRKYYPDLAPVHTHSLAGMAVASLKKGLLPMTQTAMRFAKVAYHDSLAVGRSIAEAFNNAYRPRARLPHPAPGPVVQRRNTDSGKNNSRKDFPPVSARRAPHHVRA